MYVCKNIYGIIETIKINTVEDNSLHRPHITELYKNTYFHILPSSFISTMLVRFIQQIS